MVISGIMINWVDCFVVWGFVECFFDFCDWCGVFVMLIVIGKCIVDGVFELLLVSECDLFVVFFEDDYV